MRERERRCEERRKRQKEKRWGTFFKLLIVDDLSSKCEREFAVYLGLDVLNACLFDSTKSRVPQNYTFNQGKKRVECYSPRTLVVVLVEHCKKRETVSGVTPVRLYIKRTEPCSCCSIFFSFSLLVTKSRRAPSLNPPGDADEANRACANSLKFLHSFLILISVCFECTKTPPNSQPFLGSGRKRKRTSTC